MSSEQLHEPRERLEVATVEMHRAIASLMEELEAIDWYGQRVDACEDETLRVVLEHNRDEEKEHAAMTLEWIRRNDATFARHLRRFLFTDGPIAGREHGAVPAGDGGASPDLAIGSLRAVKEMSS